MDKYVNLGHLYSTCQCYADSRPSLNTPSSQTRLSGMLSTSGVKTILRSRFCWSVSFNKSTGGLSGIVPKDREENIKKCLIPQHFLNIHLFFIVLLFKGDGKVPVIMAPNCYFGSQSRGQHPHFPLPIDSFIHLFALIITIYIFTQPFSFTIFKTNVSQHTNCMIWANYWFDWCSGMKGADMTF